LSLEKVLKLQAQIASSLGQDDDENDDELYDFDYSFLKQSPA
jgi:hypothetical protein